TGARTFLSAATSGREGASGTVQFRENSEVAADRNVRAPGCFASGALFGIAFLMKQPGVFWGIFGLIYLAWSEFQPLRENPKQRRSANRRFAGADREWKKGLLRCGWYCLGIVTPFLVMCLALVVAGVFDRFVFWTFTYAREYVSVHPLFRIPNEELQLSFRAVFGPNLPLWLLAGLGAVLMWWD